MSKDPVEIVRRMCDSFGPSFPMWYIVRNGSAVIGAQSEQGAVERLAALERNKWRWLNCYSTSYDDPLDWVAHVRSQGWTFDEQSEIQVGSDGRVYFHGNMVEYSAAFRYLVLDPAVVTAIRAAAPEVPVAAVGVPTDRATRKRAA